ncbi:putative AT-hook motif nuclear-localized protein 28 [Cocos nucifera]|uniref:Putative AT-hook motif nuclear-localized protein 28 n=1 Tax=Cocos nucifera TaxID=13894 RepID=A0A8K0I364_COCNU|nr:putative AT-hook motif nuclear-localized protein 28 [Cocos nucifera]
MRPHVLEIPAGHDVAASLATFSRRRALALCILAAAGPVANVTLRQSPSPVEGSPSAAAVVTFGGRFDILSISATFFPPSLPAAAGGLGGGFSVSLAGPQGRVVGGMVAGPLVAAGTVVVVAAAFAEPTFDRLPVEEETAGSASASLSAGGGSGGGDEVAAQLHHNEDGHNDRDEEAHYHYQYDHFHHHHHHESSDGLKFGGLYDEVDKVEVCTYLFGMEQNYGIDDGLDSDLIKVRWKRSSLKEVHWKQAEKIDYLLPFLPSHHEKKRRTYFGNLI